ncbi:MAG: hypothetical protein HRU39_18310, partial [Salinicola sp.]|uniref:hypothetical protein n=1 Tax=Salinicola sp. TaxID=1978524 RepID=UPI001DFF48AE
SLKRIDSGNAVTQRATDSFARIVEGVAQTTDSIEEIATTASAQLETANRVDGAIRELARATRGEERARP